MALLRTSLVVAASSAALAVAMTTLSVAPAGAVQPANHACFGVDMSGYARSDDPHGKVVSSLAQSLHLGALVQQHQAGELTDEAFPNTCND